jgi:DNA polymerase-1
MGPQRLAAQTGVTLTAAREFIQRYFEVYPGIKSYTLELIEFAKRHGYCLTMMGRRRPIPELRDANQALQSRGENIAVNAPIQGSAADVIKLAMINVHALLRTKRFKTTMLLQVHDELVFSAPESELPDVVPLIRGAMESAVETRVPLKVDISWGANWLSAH